jgi:hypothetical protein
MRTLLEIFVVAVLIYVGWQIPFRDRLPASISGVAKSTPVPITVSQTQPRPIARSTSTPPNGEWMWDPNHRSALDRPAYDSKEPRYEDSLGRKYWIDGRGVKHYVNEQPTPH